MSVAAVLLIVWVAEIQALRQTAHLTARLDQIETRLLSRPESLDDAEGYVALLQRRMPELPHLHSAS